MSIADNATLQLSGNDSLTSAWAGMCESDVRRGHRVAAEDIDCGYFTFADADGTAGECEKIASGNVPASVSEIVGVTEFLAGKTRTGAADEQYAEAEAVSYAKAGTVWVYADESSAGAIKDGVPCYCRIDTTVDGKATDTSSSNILVGVFRSTLNSRGVAKVELRLGV